MSEIEKLLQTRLKLEHALSIPLVYPLGKGADSTVYVGQHNGSTVAVKVSPSAVASERLPFLRSLLALAPHEAVSPPTSVIGEVGDYIVSCWEEADATLLDLLTANNSTFLPLSRRDAIDILQPVVEGMDHIRKMGIQQGDLHPSAIWKFSGKYRVGDISGSHGGNSNRYLPKKGDWREVASARDVHVLSVIYFWMRVGLHPHSNAGGPAIARAKEALDRDERQILDSILVQSWAKPTTIMVDATCWLTALQSAGTASVEEAVTKPSLRIYWLEKENLLQLESAAVVPPLAVQIDSHDGSTAKSTVDGVHGSVAVSPQAKLFDVEVADAGSQRWKFSFKMGDDIQGQVIGQEVTWEKAGWNSVGVSGSFRNHATEAIPLVTGTPEGGKANFVRDGRQELDSIDCYLTPVGEGGVRGPSSVLSIGPDERHVRVTFRHVWEDKKGEFLRIDLDASRCRVPPRAKVVWEQSIEESSDEVLVDWDATHNYSLTLDEIVTRDVVKVLFLDDDIASQSVVCWRHEEDRLPTPSYDYEVKT